MSPWVISSESREISGDKNPTCHTSQRKSEIKCKSEAKKQKEDIEPEANFISVSESLVFPIESGTLQVWGRSVEPAGRGWGEGVKAEPLHTQHC